MQVFEQARFGEERAAITMGLLAEHHNARIPDRLADAFELSEWLIEIQRAHRLCIFTHETADICSSRAVRREKQRDGYG